MLFRWVALLALVAPVIASSPSSSHPESVLQPRDGHGHGYHNPNASPLLMLNETEVTLYHAPTPPSYYTIDWEDEGYQNRHGGLMVVHGLFMSLAFFGSLPIGVYSSSL
jgi:hypothetical protein